MSPDVEPLVGLVDQRPFVDQCAHVGIPLPIECSFHDWRSFYESKSAFELSSSSPSPQLGDQRVCNGTSV
jgi:hypothetical protein